MKARTAVLTTLGLLVACAAAHAVERPFDGNLEAFLGESKLEIQQVFRGGRFPNIVTAVDGTVLAVWGNVTVRRSEDGGETWGEEIRIGQGHMGGGVTVNEANGDIFAFLGEGHPPTTETVYRSQDHGKTWDVVEVEIKPDSKGNKPDMHMNEHGITLRHGEHKGRLIRPARHYENYRDRTQWKYDYTTAIYSDDGGKTWLTSEPFPVLGTGEACIVELSDGTLHYNTRRHVAPDREDAIWRWTANSTDGGVTWQNPTRSHILPDGNQNSIYGLMGGLVRLPVLDRDILIFSNIVHPTGRRNGHVWASFDGGKTWPVRRQVNEGGFAYSSLNAGRPGTKSEGWIYLLFEGGGGQVARFNLSWLLQGEKTGDGEVPAWILRSAKAGEEVAAE